MAGREPYEEAAEEADEPEWRAEVSRRLEKYRERRVRLHPGDSQSGLPFLSAGDVESDFAEPEPEHEPERVLRQLPEQLPEQRYDLPRPRPSLRQRQSERVEICIQPELDFLNAPDDRAHPQTALVPVASLAQRRSAGAVDALFLVVTFAGFLGLFRSLGGQLTFDKTEIIVYFTIGYLFYAIYLALFTTLAGSTPGMQFRGLTIVRLDGTLPDTRQLLWRSFGYLLSGATLMLGFVWALWDEDHFTWHDRMSHTYVTAAPPIDSFDAPPVHHTFAHK